MGIQDIPKRMKACQVVEYNEPYKIHEVDVPSSLGPHDLLVKVAVASLCHTDGMVQAGTFGTKLPCTASHEGSGTIASVGSEVKIFKVGDRVMCGIPKDRCGSCSDCRGDERYRQYCVNVSHVGVTLDGCFADYVLCDSRSAAKLPNEVSFETAAPLACAGCTIYRGIIEADLKPGQWLGIVGSGGGLGHLGIQFAKAFGLKIAAIDARDEGLELSRKYLSGEQYGIVVDARAKDAVEQVQKATNGQGCDATVNVSDAQSAAKTACEITKMHGTMVQIAQPNEVSIPFKELVFRDIRVKGSLISSAEESRNMLDVVAKHKISVNTNAFNGLDELPKLIELAHGGKMKGKGIVIVDSKQVEEEKKLAKEQA